MRQKSATEVLVNPAGPVANKPKLRVDPTNVHVPLLQQEVIFANWWAQIVPKKPVGLAQRFLFALGGDADPARSVCSVLCVAWGHASRRLLNPTWCAQLRKARSSLASWRPFRPHCPRDEHSVEHHCRQSLASCTEGGR